MAAGGKEQIRFLIELEGFAGIHQSFDFFYLHDGHEDVTMFGKPAHQLRIMASGNRLEPKCWLGLSG